MLCIDKKLTWSTHVYIEVRNGEEEEEVDGSQPTHPTLGLVWSGVLQGEVRKWGVADDNSSSSTLGTGGRCMRAGCFYVLRRPPASACYFCSRRPLG